MQWLVGDEVRLQRGPLPGTSGRAIHVGNPNGVNYTFDPRLLAIVKIWQGGFLEMSGEFTNRGNNGLALGYDSREIGFGDREYLLDAAESRRCARRLQLQGRQVRGLRHVQGRRCTARKTSSRASPPWTRSSWAIRATRPTSSPRPRSSIASARMSSTSPPRSPPAGDLAINVSGALATSQVFALNPALLKGATVSAGSIATDRWTLPAGKTNATLKGHIAVAGKAWRPSASNYAYKRAPLVKTPSKATLPAGYSIEDYFAPKDNYGREQLFEALGSVGDQGRHRRRRHAQRRAVAHREWRVAAVRRRVVRQPRRRRRRRQGTRRRRRPEGRAHAHLRHQRRWHRRQVRNAVRRALVSRQLSQLHARTRAWT